MKVGGSYEAVVLGVSEQVAQDRRSGQHEAQLNMVSDPVHGLARRRGSLWQDEKILGVAGVHTLANQGPEGAKMREYTFTIDGVEYALLYRPFASTKGSTYFMHCYRKSDNKLLNVSYQAASLVNSLIAGGVSAVTNVGRYLYIAGNSIVPSYTTTDLHGAPSNLSKMVAWVRGGAYSRTFTIRLTKNDNTVLTVSYKTKASSYPTLNDTSDIAASDPEYQKKVNDRNNLYNSNVTKWIGEAAEDIQGENIAEKLKLALVAAGVTGVSRVDSTVVINNTGYKDISCDDGGDNTLMRAVGSELSSPDKLSVLHYPGKLVKVRPTSANELQDAFYMKAYAKDEVSTSWCEVVWREAAGEVITPTAMWAQAAIQGDTLYVAADGPGLLGMGVTGPHPGLVASVAGDSDSSPVPAFFGEKITMLAVFQDRLLVGSNGTVNASRPGDYLNFFRSTVLNVNDDDPVEMFAYGSEGDILRSSTTFDRDLVLFGDKKQYVITGRAVLTPRSPNIQVLASYKDATSCPPVSSGNFVFYATLREGKTAAHQFQVGQQAENPASYEISGALDKYIVGTPAQLMELTSPNVLVLRTEGYNGLHVYSYLDSPDGGQRLFDSWSKWEYAAMLGTIVGVTADNGDIVTFTYRQGGNTLYLVADRITLDTDLSDYPYADSLRKGGTPVAGNWHESVAASTLIAAMDSTTTYHLIGDRYDRLTALIAQLPGTSLSKAWIGAEYPSYVTPTNPFMRDGDGKAQLNGRLTLGTLRISVSTTGGMIGEVSTVNGGTSMVVTEGRLVGRPSNIIGTQPLATGQVSLGVGREVRECKYTLRATTWLPMTITAIEWTGQWFNRLRRG